MTTYSLIAYGSAKFGMEGSPKQCLNLKVHRRQGYIAAASPFREGTPSSLAFL